MIAKLALRAITLRGIGPYLHGARLDVRPLTIVCGTNGSGKSTWFKALNMLKESLDIEGFPFRWKAQDDAADDVEFTSAFLNWLDPDREYPFLRDRQLERDFGPPGTVTLEFECTQSFALPNVEGRDVDEQVPQSFLWQGQCRRGMRFRIRLCHLTHYEERDISGLYHLVELQVDDESTIRFATHDHWSNRYTVECSASFLPQFSALSSNQILQVAECSDELTAISPVPGLLDQEDAELVVNYFASRIRQLLTELLSGYFFIGAIRHPHPYQFLGDATINDDFDFERAISTRYVGPQGEATWKVERTFAYNEMSPAPLGRPGTAVSDDLLFERDFVSPWLERLLDTSIQSQQSPSLNWTKAELPTSYLIDDHPCPDEERNKFEYNLDHGDLARIEHPCFGANAQNPKQMSSGFHQLMPLIVQAGLMREYEIMAVENPEVHLHPKLQLDVAEFLMRQACAGKWIMIETHSDLIVRRVIREMLEEKIGMGQERIGIYFVGADNSEILTNSPIPQRHRYATLEPIEVDNRGRIANWPPGFMDDDVRESRRLLEIMYPPTGIDLED